MLPYLQSQRALISHLSHFLGKHMYSLGGGRKLYSLQSFLCDVQKGPALGILEMKGTELEKKQL